MFKLDNEFGGSNAKIEHGVRGTTEGSEQEI